MADNNECSNLAKVPVLVLAFNRADHVAKAMEAIREYKPERLYLECDGARKNKEGEAEAVELTRRTMLDMVDWPCEVKTLFREENLGCANAVYGAITWFFEHEEWGVIIEDDVVVGQDFFRLCEELLPRYKDEERIMEISALNYNEKSAPSNSYVYSQSFHCWGWASWSRAWKYMDMEMSSVPSMSLIKFTKQLGFPRGFYLYFRFKRHYAHIASFTSWASRWWLSICMSNGLVICPGVNMAVNIGMTDGTHYNYSDIDPHSQFRIGKMQWPLDYNDKVALSKHQMRFDNYDYTRDRIYGIINHIRRIIRYITNCLRKLYKA